MAIRLFQGVPGSGMSLSRSGCPSDVNVGAFCVTTPAPAGQSVTPLSPGEVCKAAPLVSRVVAAGAVLPLCNFQG